ncbi:MAG: phage integrase SAM-like domain-containing protein [Flavobacteriales bacterium]|nr:phage integrase SAM-like domain-containing protein [Flavobacteriales bacterium]
MATVNFRLRKVKESKQPILVYLSLGRDNIFQLKTGFVIDLKDWSKDKKKPLQNNESNKKLFNDLKKLESFIYAELNESQSKGEIINRNWLQNTINDCFNRTTKDENETNLLINQYQYIIENADTKQIKGSSRIGLSENRIKGYVTSKNLMLEFEKFLKKQIYLTDIDNVLIEKFKNWLIKTKQYSRNYSGKQIDNLKSVCNDVVGRGIKINDFVDKIQSFKEYSDDRHIITLSFDELEQIKNSYLSKEYLINVRKWLLIGCEIGQRGNDLLNITKDNVRYTQTTMYIDVKQQKTRKHVSVGIYNEYVERVIKNEFPYKISIQKFNDYLKELCKECGINEQTKGCIVKMIDKNNKRRITGVFPKYELISSHICRRSFASNYYKDIPTPILMEITAHSKESQFLEYIAKPKDKDANANLFLKLVKEMKSNKESQLKAV